MQSYGVYVNSAYNGVGLETSVHSLTYSSEYVETINKAVLQLDNLDAIVEFLGETARVLHKLNDYADDVDILADKFAEFLSNMKGVSQ